MSTGIDGAKPVVHISEVEKALEAQPVIKGLNIRASDSLGSGKAQQTSGIRQKISAVFSWVKEKIKSLFHFIFGRFFSIKAEKVKNNSSESQLLTPLQKLSQERILINRVLAFFTNDVKEKNIDEAKSNWKSFFNTLPSHTQNRIIKEEIRRAGGDLRQNDKGAKEKAVKFVRDLETDEQGVNPIRELSTHLENISIVISDEIKALETKSETLTALQKLQQDQRIISSLNNAFEKGKESPRPQFKEKWKTFFDLLPTEIKEKIIAEEMRNYARYKKQLEGSDIDQYVIDNISDQQKRAYSLEFVKDLEPDGGMVPIEDLPVFLENISNQIQAEIKALEGEVLN